MHVNKQIGRPSLEIKINDEDRDTLERWARGRTVSHQLVQRAKMILLCSKGIRSPEVAVKVGVASWTVSKWRRRFADGGLQSLYDRTRPNTARKLSDEKVEEVLRTTIETTPKGQTHWSTRQLSKKLGVSQSSVSRIWRAFKLQPHRQTSLSAQTIFS